MTTKTKEPTIRELQKVQRVLQTAHDYIEIHGFNIDVAAEKDADGRKVGSFTINRQNNDKYKDGRNGKMDVGKCCFIGVTRLSVGANPFAYDIRTDSGDGPELTLAMEVLDNIAGDFAESEGLEAEPVFENEPCRLAEEIGFVMKRHYGYDYKEGGEQQQNDFALDIFRKALTDVYNKIESKRKKKK